MFLTYAAVFAQYTGYEYTAHFSNMAAAVAKKMAGAMRMANTFGAGR